MNKVLTFNETLLLTILRFDLKFQIRGIYNFHFPISLEYDNCYIISFFHFFVQYAICIAIIKFAVHKCGFISV